MGKEKRITVKVISCSQIGGLLIPQQCAEGTDKYTSVNKKGGSFLLNIVEESVALQYPHDRLMTPF